jgi:hypothetical protein
MDTALQEVVEQDAHHRLVCAVENRPYVPPAERAKVATLAEALRRGEPIDGVLEGHARLPEDAHAQLVAAVRGAAYVALPAGAHARLAEAVGGSRPALPADDLHARLVRAFKS